MLLVSLSCHNLKTRSMNVLLCPHPPWFRRSVEDVDMVAFPTDAVQPPTPRVLRDPGRAQGIFWQRTTSKKTLLSPKWCNNTSLKASAVIDLPELIHQGYFLSVQSWPKKQRFSERQYSWLSFPWKLLWLCMHTWPLQKVSSWLIHGNKST